MRFLKFMKIVNSYRFSISLDSQTPFVLGDAWCLLIDYLNISKKKWTMMPAMLIKQMMRLT